MTRLLLCMFALALFACAPSEPYYPKDDNVTAVPSTQGSSGGSSSTGGPVYVHGYTRRDGTYVRPHTRRR